MPADEPAVSYIFPAGGQRGTKVDFRVGGMYLHDAAAFEMLGPGVAASPAIARTETLWFEGPLVPLPASQQKEDYPQDYAGQVEILADAPPGLRYWRVATSQGATQAMKFVVGELPEVVERETEGEPVPVSVRLPVTVNGRIFPREDVDDWSFEAKQGELIRAEVLSARLGLPLEARLVLVDTQGRPLAEDAGSLAGDACLHAVIPADGRYRVRIHDVNFSGMQNFVYRLTLTRGPHVEHVFPLGGRGGQTVRLELAGQGLPADPVEIAIPADASSPYRCRATMAGGEINSFLLDVDDLPETLEAEPNGLAEQAAPLTAPVVANGRIGAPGDKDCWAVALHKDDVVEFDVRAARLGSPLDAVLVVLDAAGRELARADDLPNNQTDTRLPFTAPADGVYVVRVEERFASRGGRAFAYRLRIAPPPARDFRLALAADALTLYRGGQAKMRVTAERWGECTEAIKLAVEGLPEGVTVNGGEIAERQSQSELVFAADKAARIQTAHLAVRGTAVIGGEAKTRTASVATPQGEPALDNVLLAVAMPTPYKVVGTYDITFVPRGSLLRRHYRIERNGFEGPLEVQLADRQMRHLQGVTGPRIVVPEGASEFDYTVYLPPWMELGRTSRSVVMAVGKVFDVEGRPHTVSFTSQNQNEQIVAIVGPGELGLRAEPASLAAQADGQADVVLHLARDKSLDAAVRVELVVPSHIAGIAAEPLTIAAGESRGALRLRFSHEFGPLNMPLTVRATTQRGELPLVAETKLELVAGREP